MNLSAITRSPGNNSACEYVGYPQLLSVSSIPVRPARSQPIELTKKINPQGLTSSGRGRPVAVT